MRKINSSGGMKDILFCQNTRQDQRMQTGEAAHREQRRRGEQEEEELKEEEGLRRQDQA